MVSVVVDSSKLIFFSPFTPLADIVNYFKVILSGSIS